MKKKRNRVLLIVLLGVAVISAGALIFFSRIDASLKALTDVPVAAIDPATLEDGTYAGSYSAFPVSAEVRVTVRDHAFTGIELVKHTHGQGAGAEVIPDRVLAAQSLQVDSVAGATYSSKVILLAIQDALLKDAP